MTQTALQHTVSTQPGVAWTAWQLPAPLPQVVQIAFTAPGVSLPPIGAKGPMLHVLLGEQR